MTSDRVTSAAFRDLLGRLRAFSVDIFALESDDPQNSGGREREVAGLANATVASSLLKEREIFSLSPWGDDQETSDRHIIVIDVDHVAHLVPSTTQGHSHLYVEIPPVDSKTYFEFLDACVKVGLIEEGYAGASRRRGHSDVRLPWIKKRPRLLCCRCGMAATGIGEYIRGAAEDLGIDIEGGAEPPTPAQVEHWAWHNEGTVNKETGQFYCTTCYVAAGQPLGTA